MTRPLVWYDGQEGDIDRCVLWDTLRRHGFVDGAMQTQDADTLRRVAELAEELFEEITASEGERLHQRERRQATAGDLAIQAVTYALDRIQTDPDLAYVVDPFTELFHRLCLAEAAHKGQPLEDVKDDRSEDQQPEHRRRKARVVELEERIAELEARDG